MVAPCNTNILTTSSHRAKRPTFYGLILVYGHVPPLPLVGMRHTVPNATSVCVQRNAKGNEQKLHVKRT